MILSLGIGGGYYFYNVFFEKNTVFDDDYIYLKIPTNSSKDQIIDSLSIYLEDTSKFIKAANYKDYFKNIKSGRFKIEKNYNNNEIINSLRSNNIPVNLFFF